MAELAVRDRILESAAQRFAEFGPMATTLDDVRAEAGASVGAVYHHFPDKEALYAAVCMEALAAYQRAFLEVLERHPDAEEGIKTIVAFHLRWCVNHRGRAKLLLAGRPAGAGDLNREFFAHVRAWWRPHAHYGAIRDLDLLLAHSLWLGPAIEISRHWLEGNARKPSRSDSNALADAAWRTLKEEPR